MGRRRRHHRVRAEQREERRRFRGHSGGGQPRDLDLEPSGQGRRDGSPVREDHRAGAGNEGEGPEDGRQEKARDDKAQSEAAHNMNMDKADCILFSGAAPGAEAEFGACAERHGIEEVNFTFEGHTEARRRGIRVLNHEELQAGDVSLEYVSKLMHRRYSASPTLGKILQTLWDQVNSGQETYGVGAIMAAGTARGGTG